MWTKVVVEKEVEARVGQESKRGLLISKWRHGARRRLRTSRLSPGRAASFCINGQHFSDSEIEVPDVFMAGLTGRRKSDYLRLQKQ
jgi:hypothetical protein